MHHPGEVRREATLSARQTACVLWNMSRASFVKAEEASRSSCSGRPASSTAPCQKSSRQSERDRELCVASA
eukprot:1209019-Rhodomonas_salina.1